MMKKLGYLLFLAAFLVLALLPSLGMLFFGPQEAAAGEAAAEAPSLRTDGSFNTRVLNDASDWFAEGFWPRQRLITLNARLEALLGTSASDEVVLGREGWLFYAETLDDYRGRNLMTDRQVWAAARSLALVQEYAASRGVRTLFVMAPNKNAIYPEYMPAWALAAEGDTNADLLFAALAEQGVEALDLRPVLTEQKSRVQLYHALDSHWNNLGAAAAHDAILAALGREGTAFRPSDYKARQDFEPDLAGMLYPADPGLDWQFYPEAEPTFTYPRPIRSAMDQRFLTVSETGTGKALVFRDSFCNSLHTFLAESFESACFSRALPYNLLTPDLEGADVLLMELAQRNLIRLAQDAPVLPAPVRSVDFTDAAEGPTLEVACADAGSSLWVLTGEIKAPLDTDSPVYLIADGVVYEATPAGPTPENFTAYLAAAPAGLRILWYADGSPVLAEAVLTAGTAAPAS